MVDSITEGEKIIRILPLKFTVLAVSFLSQFSYSLTRNKWIKHFKTSSGFEIHFLKLHFKVTNVLISLLNSDHLTLFDFLGLTKFSNKIKMTVSNSFVYTTPSLRENRYVQKIGCKSDPIHQNSLQKTAKLKKISIWQTIWK